MANGKVNLTHFEVDTCVEIARLEVAKDALAGMRRMMTTEEGIDTMNACIGNIESAIAILEDILEGV